MKILSLTLLLFLVPATSFSMGISWKEQYALDQANFEIFVEKLKTTWKNSLKQNNLLPFTGYTDDDLINLIYNQYSADIESMASDSIDTTENAEFARSFLRTLISNYDKEILHMNTARILINKIDLCN